MTTATHERRQLRETPHRAEHHLSVGAVNTARTVMPKTLDGLIAWYSAECFGELPDELHSAQVWRDKVSLSEAAKGVRPVGASDTGSLAYAEDFRKVIEEKPTTIDEDGFYRRPIASALSRLAYKSPPKGGRLMVKRLLHLSRNGFDWRRQADAIGRTTEEHHTWLFQALVSLWLEFREERIAA